MEALVTCSQGVIRRISACLVPYRKGRFMSRREGIGVGTVVLVIVSLFVALVGVGGVYLLVTDRLDGFLAGLGITRPDGEGSQGDTVATSEDKTELTAYAGLTWTELQSISQKIAAAPSDAEGISIAAEYGLCDSSGAIVSNATELVLSDNTLAYVQLVGIRQDRRADGSGVAGLTFMAYMISEQPMGATPSCAGGWSASALRSWLESESARSLLPDEMASVIVPVTKLTNNVGLTSSVSSVTTTDDSLWAFSAHEVCGDVSWFSHDYGSWYSDYDDVLNAEGGQYQYFSQQGVTSTSDATGVLALTYRGSSRPWWYRSPYPYSVDGNDAIGYFYQANESGYPSSLGQSDSTAGVVVGFCV